MNLYERMIAWLDAEEGRSLTLCSANADFDGPSHCIVWTTMNLTADAYAHGETREECMDEIERASIAEKRCPICGGTEHVPGLPGTHGPRCVKCCDITDDSDGRNYPHGRCVLCGCEVHPSCKICGECACEDDGL